MTYPDNERYIYAIAGGETLQMLEKLKANAEAAKAALEKMAQDLGAKISFDPCDSLFTFTGALPAGWEKFPSRGGDMFNPDQSTKEGRKIASDISWNRGKMNIHSAFTEACRKYSGASNWNNYQYSFEEIGGKIVVKCPPGNYAGNGQPTPYYIPPDSTLITFSEYAKMKEDAGLLPAAVLVNVFKNKFDL
jgi:hypothetical protein